MIPLSTSKVTKPTLPYHGRVEYISPHVKERRDFVSFFVKVRTERSGLLRVLFHENFVGEFDVGDYIEFEGMENNGWYLVDEDESVNKIGFGSARETREIYLDYVGKAKGQHCNGVLKNGVWIRFDVHALMNFFSGMASSEIAISKDSGVGPSYFSTLGLPMSASEDDIKKAYRQLVRKYHPDADGDVDKFNEIREAYEALSNPKTRKKILVLANLGNATGYREEYRRLIGVRLPLNSSFTPPVRSGKLNVDVERDVVVKIHSWECLVKTFRYSGPLDGLEFIDGGVVSKIGLIEFKEFESRFNNLRYHFGSFPTHVEIDAYCILDNRWDWENKEVEVMKTRPIVKSFKLNSEAERAVRLAKKGAI